MQKEVLLNSIMLSIILLFFLPLQKEKHYSSFEEIVLEQFRTKKNMAAFDCYKLVYQGTFGVEHFVVDSAQMAKALLEEMKDQEKIPTDSSEELYEQLTVNNEIVRVNLRPFRDKKYPLIGLIRAIVQTAKEMKKDTALFYKEWNSILQLQQDKKIALEKTDIETIQQAFLNQGMIFPVHHSYEYQEANKPSYRIVKRALFEKYCGKK